MKHVPLLVFALCLVDKGGAVWGVDSVNGINYELASETIHREFAQPMSNIVSLLRNEKMSIARF